ncbi:Alpha-(1,3)-fucosyltransferase C [Toxocara canis]|uniref:Fucosyltransferase n=2 Tax=Toxocara canis TaxID=6265 RepID=A0A0B2VRQ5_TOXCA|nr:Alpha-(1,3)-fucosyltransferase C [Toxocara canis]VDM42427.1 unnamed protein product [Toxocara canis]
MALRKRSLMRILLFCVLLTFGVSCLFLLRSFGQSDHDVRLREQLHADASSPKLILQWSNIFGNELPQAVMEECSPPLQKSCSISADRSRLNEASAVVFHISEWDLRTAGLPKSKDRSYRQLYVFMTMEAPPSHSRTVIAAFPPNFFNITMTYRRDSDVPYPYGGYWVQPQDAKRLGFMAEQLPYDEKTILKSKSKSIFWLVSNCATPSKREVAVEKLSRHIGVDIFGKCASNETMRNACKRNEECEQKMAAEYYFFIAAENCICKDYVTEKYWDRYGWPIVPIVMRRHIYERLLPPKSFIAMDDFGSAEQMANYLGQLMSNKSAYMEYFAWRSTGWARPWQKPPYRVAYCKLCERLYEDTSPSSIENVEKWFYDTAECEGPQFADSWPELDG